MKKTSDRSAIWILLVSFLIPFLIMIVVCIVDGIYPFGTKCFLRTDLYNQYVPFYSELQQKLKAGEGLDFSWQLGLGSNFMGVYAYYLASPTALLSVLVPGKYLIEFMTLLILCKIGFSGFSFCFYLKGHYGEAKLSMIWFSVFYALSGFMAAYNWNIMWLDSVALAPLIILGLEKLVYEKKWLLYTLTLGASIWINYYISIMICIFLVLYYVVLIVSKKGFLKDLKNAGSSFLRFAGCSVLAAALAGIVILPGTLAILSTGFASSTFPKNLTLYFGPLDVLARHSMNVLTELKTDHWPNIYCGVAVFFLIPLYFLSKKVPLRKKISHGILFAFMLSGFCINVLNFLWHGFNYPDSLPARQSFLYIFLVLIMAYEAVRDLQEIHWMKLGGCILFSLLFVGLCMLAVKDKTDYTDHNAFLVTLLFLVLYGIFCTIWKYGVPAYTRKLAIGGLTVLVILEAGLNTYSTSVGNVTRSRYVDKIDNYKQINEMLGAMDDGFYRTETNLRMTKNDGVLAGFQTASMFSSTVQKGVESFYQQLGFDYSKVYYHFEGSTPLTAALLGVKYFSSNKNYWEDDFRTYIGKVNKSYVYALNENTSLGYVLPYELEDEWAFEQGNAPEAQNRFGRLMGLQEDVFEAVGNETSGNETRVLVPEKGVYYAYISGGSKTKGDTIDLTVTDQSGNEKRVKNYTNCRKGYLLCLGECTPDDKVVLTTSTGSMDQVKVHTYLCRTLVMKELLSKLTSQSFIVTEVGPNSLKGRVTAEKNGVLVLSVPYDKGFRITIDGMELVEKEAFCDAFLEIPVTAGEHRIVLKFIPRGKYAGMVMTFVSAAIILILLIRSRQKN